MYFCSNISHGYHSLRNYAILQALIEVWKTLVRSVTENTTVITCTRQHPFSNSDSYDFLRTELEGTGVALYPKVNMHASLAIPGMNARCQTSCIMKL